MEITRDELGHIFSYVSAGKKSKDGKYLHWYVYTCRACGEKIEDYNYTASVNLMSHATTLCPKAGAIPRSMANVGYGVNKENYGNKAEGLSLLMNAGYQVPQAFAAPMKWTFDRPEIAFPWTDDLSGTYAVRSGSSISMPGMMETKLNVHPHDFREAVQAVWDSWNSERAKAYREAKGIPHDLGTGVIIQKMVRNPLYSGVAFTNRPDNPFKSRFEPIVEYVAGYGDSLVDGSKTPERLVGTAQLTSAGNTFQKLLIHLHKIHTAFGPSDVEWAFGKFGDIYFLQRRDLKFTDTPASLPMDENGRTLLATGVSLGAKRQLVGRFSDPGSLFYSKSFDPDEAPRLIQSQGIVTLYGGTTCHAAIVAREFDKVAVGNIEPDVAADFNDKVILIDGVTGKIFLANPDEQGRYLSSLSTAPVAGEASPVFHDDRIPDFKLTKRVYRVNHLFTRFYWAIEEERKGKITREWRDQIIGEIASVICVYLYQATAGESRHIWKALENSGISIVKDPETSREYTRSDLANKMAKLGFQNYQANYSSNRSLFVMNHLIQPKSTELAYKIANLVERAFTDFSWSGAYGGEKWARITRLLVSYLGGVTTPLIFVDQCFNLHHNGGRVFGKFDWIIFSPDKLGYQLDQRRDGSLESCDLSGSIFDQAPAVSAGPRCDQCGLLLDSDGNCPGTGSDADEEEGEQEETPTIKATNSFTKYTQYTMAETGQIIKAGVPNYEVVETAAEEGRKVDATS